MKKTIAKLLNIFLVVFMVIGLVNPMHVHAEEEFFTTNKDTYYLGDAIVVDAPSGPEGSWVGLYDVDGVPGVDASYYWYYVDGGVHNIFDMTPNEQGLTVGIGKYKVMLFGDSGTSNVLATKEITIVDAPSSFEPRLEIKEKNLGLGDSLVINAVNYTKDAWIGIYDGRLDYDTDYSDPKKVNHNNRWFYTFLHNDSETKVGLPVGEYTVVLFKDGGYTPLKLEYVSVAKKELISTSKKEYLFKEDIVVDLGYKVDVTSDSWVGLFRKGEVPGASNVYAFYWNWSCDVQGENNLVKDYKPQDNTTPKYIPAGDWVLYVFVDEGYTAIDSIEFSVVPVEVRRVVNKPTCEKDGAIDVYYDDDSFKVITAKEDASLKATGHTYGKYVYNELTRTHSRTCTTCNETCGCEEATIVENCEFDAGVIVKEETATAFGEKKYTCTLCEGTYVQKYSTLEVKSETITKQPTCEEDGIKTYTFVGSDAVITEPITKLGHKYSEKLVYDEATKTHGYVCANDASHIKNKGQCTFSSSTVEKGVITFVCEECSGTYQSEDRLVVDKKTYSYGDPIYVTTNFTGKGAWVGFYKKSDTPGVTPTIFWYNVAEEDSTVNILETRDENRRGHEYIGGQYVIVLFGDSGLTNIVNSVQITVKADVKSTNVEEPTCDQDGKKTVYYTDGTIEVITADDDISLKATGHTYGNWVYDNAVKKHTRTCVNDVSHTESADCTFDSGKVTKQPSGSNAGQKTYTCSECKGTYVEEFFNDKVVSEVIIKAATCEEWGTKEVIYESGNKATVQIPNLGHAYSDWQFDSTSRTHSRQCANDKTHKEVENCIFDDGVSHSSGHVTYTCKTCKGSYTAGMLITDKSSYLSTERLWVTATCTNNNAWVGLYKKGDIPFEDDEVLASFYWYTVYDENSGIDNSGKRINLLSSEYSSLTNRKEALKSGYYQVVLFGDGGYKKVLTTIDVYIEAANENTTYEIELNGKPMNKNSTLDINIKDLKDVVVNVTADGIIDKSWVGIYNQRFSENADFSTQEPIKYWYWLDGRNGKDVSLKSNMQLPIGEYTVAVFGDEGYFDVRNLAYFNISLITVYEEVLKESTCVSWGSKYVEYEDGTSKYISTPPLGHDVSGKLTYDKDRKEHYDTCSRCGKVVEECTFDKGVITKEAVGTEAGIITYTCGECKGSYTEEYFNELPPVLQTNRVFGNTRYETSYAIANMMKEVNDNQRFDSIIIASGTNFADALAGSYLAAKKNAPILMTDGKNSTAIKTYIKNHVNLGGTVYILGGTKAVSNKVLEGLTGYTFIRLAGNDRYGTNLEILKEAGVTNEEIIVATGTGFADSLSASASGKPILLVGKKLSAEQKAYLSSVQTQQYYVIGGTSAVSVALENEVKTYGAVKRIGGSTRYQTSVMVAEQFFNNATSAVVAYGRNFPDGLCGGPLAYAMEAPLILTENSKAADAVAFTTTRKIASGVVLGGAGLVSNETTQKIFNLLNEDEIIVKQ